MRTILMLLFLWSIGHAGTCQQLRLPAIFGEHMVLQSGMEPPIWGKAKPLAPVTVSFDRQRRTFYASSDGKWQGRLPEPAPGEVYTLIISSAGEKITYTDVIGGDVFYAGGQSNMQYSLQESTNGKDALATAANQQIRLFTVPRDVAYRPRFDINRNAAESSQEGEWQLCSPQTAVGFSAVAYFFVQGIQQATNRPVGIINVSWGGTPIEAHTSGEGNGQLAYFSEQLAYFAARATTDSLTIDKKKAVPQWPSSVFNAMVHPLIPFGLKGFLWYQGEQNWNMPFRYRHQLVTFINDLRIRWQQGYLPFYFVQLSNMGKKPANASAEDFWSILRESQAQALQLPNTGMVVSVDIGDGDLHPKNKKPFGDRLAALALHHIYRRNTVGEGPMLKETRIVGDTIVLAFGGANGGLSFKNDTATGFAIAGPDKKFYWAEASIRADQVLVYSPQVKNAKAVRYGWGENPVVSLYNGAGWPASPFRTDDWPVREDGKW